MGDVVEAFRAVMQMPSPAANDRLDRTTPSPLSNSEASDVLDLILASDFSDGLPILVRRIARHFRLSTTQWSNVMRASPAVRRELLPIMRFDALSSMNHIARQGEWDIILELLSYRFPMPSKSHFLAGVHTMSPAQLCALQKRGFLLTSMPEMIEVIASKGRPDTLERLLPHFKSDASWAHSVVWNPGCLEVFIKLHRLTTRIVVKAFRAWAKGVASVPGELLAHMIRELSASRIDMKTLDPLRVLLDAIARRQLRTQDNIRAVLEALAHIGVDLQRKHSALSLWTPLHEFLVLQHTQAAIALLEMGIRSDTVPTSGLGPGDSLVYLDAEDSAAQKLAAMLPTRREESPLQLLHCTGSVCGFVGKGHFLTEHGTVVDVQSGEVTQLLVTATRRCCRTSDYSLHFLWFSSDYLPYFYDVVTQRVNEGEAMHHYHDEGIAAVNKTAVGINGSLVACVSPRESVVGVVGEAWRSFTPHKSQHHAIHRLVWNDSHVLMILGAEQREPVVRFLYANPAAKLEFFPDLVFPGLCERPLPKGDYYKLRGRFSANCKRVVIAVPLESHHVRYQCTAARLFVFNVETLTSTKLLSATGRKVPLKSPYALVGSIMLERLPKTLAANSCFVTVADHRVVRVFTAGLSQCVAVSYHNYHSPLLSVDGRCISSSMDDGTTCSVSAACEHLYKWSPKLHARCSRRFQKVVRLLLMCTLMNGRGEPRRPHCVLHMLPHDVLLMIVALSFRIEKDFA
eukprot:TRINITY_DN176_c0_g1_i1.p1 TRINITY_DN176_c0_g1~~TRINITY_DN176_c0_g1_i1.p1  ORF type:complete len:741 (+),score=106.95 TRINITY_DN176_c0_g1_i1:1205-3427(+)